MVDIGDIPDFPGLPGQRPTPGDPTTVVPVAVVLVASALDSEYRNIALNSAAVDAFIDTEIGAGRALSIEVERWSPWSPLQIEDQIADAAQYNYGRFTIGGRSWYAFLSADYLNLTGTRFDVIPDEWTTYDPIIGYSMVARGHVAVAASAAGDISFCLEPEDFTPGDLIGYGSYVHDPLGTPRVLVISTTDLRANPFVAVDNDFGDTASDIITDSQATGTIIAPDPTGSAAFGYNLGATTTGFDDQFYYPYANSPGLSGGNTMYRPAVTGATPSTVDGIAVEGGAFIYASVGAFVTHMSKLAHAPWIAGGISRAVLIPGGSGGGLAPITLTPWDDVQSFSGAPSYAASVTTNVDTDTLLTNEFRTNLPTEYFEWTKMQTAPFCSISVGDRLGSVVEFTPQEIIGLPGLTLHTEGPFYPEADLAVWLVGANSQAAPNSPISLSLANSLPHFEVGRDVAFGGQAAEVAAERSQSAIDQFLAAQQANVDTTYTRSSAYTSTQYAIAETI